MNFKKMNATEQVLNETEKKVQNQEQEKKRRMYTGKVLIWFIINLCRQLRFSWPSLTICSYWSSFLTNLLVNIQSLYRADEFKFLLVEQYWCVHVLESIGESYWMVCEMGG